MSEISQDTGRRIVAALGHGGRRIGLVPAAAVALEQMLQLPDGHRIVGVSWDAEARDYGAAEDVRLLCGEAAAELDRLETLAAVRDWAATSASVHLGGVIDEAQTVLRAIHDEAECVDLPSGSLTLLTGEMKTRLADALLLCPKCCRAPGCPDCKAVHDMPEGS